jgi:hypothetical protein
MTAAIAYVIDNWHRHDKVVSISRALDYRRARDRQQWLRNNTRPMPPKDAA